MLKEILCIFKVFLQRPAELCGYKDNLKCFLRLLIRFFSLFSVPDASAGRKKKNQTWSVAEILNG